MGTVFWRVSCLFRLFPPFFPPIFHITCGFVWVYAFMFWMFSFKTNVFIFLYYVVFEMYYMYISVNTFHDGYVWKRRKKKPLKKKGEKKLLTHPDIDVNMNMFKIKSSLLKKGEREWTSYDCRTEVSTHSLFFFLK